MFFWNCFAFSMIQQMLAIWSVVPLPFLNPASTFGNSQFMHCWSLAWRILSITLLACEMIKYWYSYYQRIFCLLFLLGVLEYYIYVYDFKPFWVSFCVLCESVSNLIDLLIAVQLFQDHLLNKLSFPHFTFLPLLSKIDHRCVGLFGLCSVPLIRVYVLVPIPRCFDYCNL